MRCFSRDERKASLSCHRPQPTLAFFPRSTSYSTNMAADVVGKLAQNGFRHMLDTLQHGSMRGVPTRVGNKERRGWVPPKDRIALWNLAPGDAVQVISGKMKGKTGTIDMVDRPRNRVYLLETEFAVGHIFLEDILD